MRPTGFIAYSIPIRCRAIDLDANAREGFAPTSSITTQSWLPTNQFGFAEGFACQWRRPQRAVALQVAALRISGFPK
jgi:hypothetical protein